ncbi:hypothetical protein BKA56DRAFT_656130 [Ilyonectria sp. MPI-CAGE-AT-0026]|nr:hypothetical protein BKA56DRAFT_656130 [Ilyonectria sp. MPI-CAGE-AT-0026]
MAGVIEVIGVVSGLLGIIQFGIDNFVEEPGEGSTFKIAVGLDGTNGLSEAGGNLPDVRVWNQNGEFVGMKADSGDVGDGNLGEVHVNHENQGVYTLFSANDNAICIAWVTTSWSEDRGGNHYAVQGDMGYHCGASWYYSGMYYNSNEDQWNRPPEDQPKCFWIDKNGDQPSTGFQVRWPAFSTSEVDPNAPPEQRDPKSKCDNVSFGVRSEEDPNYINYWTRRKRRHLTGAPGQLKRQHSRRNEVMESQLIVGDVDGLSARFLCESATSVGPDLANTSEGLFCDMGEKKLYDLCSESVQAGCFDIDSKTLRPAFDGMIASLVASRAVSRGEKTYKTTLDWRKNQDTVI